MYLDALTLSALVDEFLDVLVGGRVQDTLDVHEDALGLEVYANHRRQYLYMSADHQTPRVHLVGEKMRRGLAKPSQMGMLFRRYVEGGLITHVSQPAWERIIHLDVQGPEGDVVIVVEPMERRSNILLLRDGIIMDCMRRVGPEDNRYRLSLPSHEYVPPPPQVGKLSPFTLSPESLQGIFEQNDDPKRKTQQLLSTRLLGVSPLLSREILFRAGVPAEQKAKDADPEPLYIVLKALMSDLSHREWRPGIVEDDNGIQAFSVYPIESMPGWHPVEQVSIAVAAYYGAPVGNEAYTAGKSPVLEAIHEAQAKVRGKLASLERSLVDDAGREVLRKSGELILAYQYTISQGQTELCAFYDPDEPELNIPLDSTLTPLENAQRYFSRYDKAKRALDDVPGMVEDTKADLAFLDQLSTDLEMAVNWPDIDEVQLALQSKGYWRGKQVSRAGGANRSAPIKISTTEGYTIWIGRNSRQNEMVTFDKARGDDFWLHAHDVPGSHVIVKYDGRTIPDHVLNRAASVAAYYSSKRGEAKVLVDVTRCKYVRKIKGAGPGMVTYRNEEPRTVVPQNEKEAFSE